MSERKQYGGAWYSRNGPNDPWVREGGPAVIQDPTAPYQGRQAEADVRQTEAQTAASRASAVSSTASADNSAANAEQTRAETDRANENAKRGRVPPTAQAWQDANDKFAKTLVLDGLIAQLESQYKTGPGSTQGANGFWDFLPTEANSNFNDTANSLNALLRDQFGFTGQEMNRPEEVQRNVGPYIPNSSTYDSTIQQRIERVKELRDNTLMQTVQTLGGIPDGRGGVIPIPEDVTVTPETILGAAAAVRDPQRQGSVWEQVRLMANRTPMSAETGGNTAIEIPEAMQTEFQNWFAENRDNMTAALYADKRAELDRRYLNVESDPSRYLEEGAGKVYTLQNSGTVNLTIPPPERPMTGVETLNNGVIDNPVGAAAANFFDAATAGLPSAFSSSDKFSALQGEYPKSSMLGQIAGSIVATKGLSSFGQQTAGRLAPWLLREGGGAQFARNLATDAVYGGLHGGITNGDPLSGAFEASVGSGVGQTVGKGIGAAVSGVPETAAAQYLRESGIPYTVGQRVGGTLKRWEENAQSLPIVGDMIRNRYDDSMLAFNQAGSRTAGNPIGARIDQVGREGVDFLDEAVSNAYEDFASLPPAPIDNQLAPDLLASNLMPNIPTDVVRATGKVMNARVAPTFNMSSLEPYQYQQMARSLRSARSKPPTSIAGYDDAYDQALREAEDALTAQMNRTGSPETVAALNNANQAYRNTRILDDATMSAKGGSQSGTNYFYTPAQLQAAVAASRKKFPGTTELSRLADAGQEVFSRRVPNSATTDRALQAALLGGGLATIGGGGAGYLATGDAQGAGVGASIPTAALIFAALGGTRYGQRALNASLNRPLALQTLGRGVKRNAGLFGSGAIPLFLNQ